MIERAGSGTDRRITGLAAELWDSFAERPFTGNVAGVVLDAADLDEGTMRAVATELGAPTTGFVVAAESGPPPAISIRYFTPVQEIDACGHVTVAVEMFQRRPEHTPSPLGSDEIEDLLGVPSDPRLPAEFSSTGLRHLVVPYPAPEDLRRLRPDFAGLAAFGREAGVDTVCAFAPDESRETRDGTVTRVRARDFCSPIGDDEEPASGTTSGALACYLFRHGIAAAEGAAVKVSVRMGVEMGRPGRVEAHLDLDGVNEVRRVSVLGRATRTLAGVMELPTR